MSLKVNQKFVATQLYQPYLGELRLLQLAHLVGLGKSKSEGVS